MCLALRDLKGYEEIGPEKILYGAPWDDVLAARRAKIERDPHVIISKCHAALLWCML